MKYINSLIDLIQTNLANLPTQAPASFMTAPNKAGITHHGPISFDTVGPLSSGVDGGNSYSSGAAKTISDTIIRHFKNAVAGIRIKQAEEEAALAIGEGNSKRWGEVEFGQ